MKINELYKPYIKSAKRINVLWGGRGSSKSWTIAQKKIMRLVSYPYCKDVILRKNYVSHKDSTYDLLQTVIISEGLADDFYFKVSPLEIVHIPTGNKLLFRGLNDKTDREKLKSIVNPTGAWMEELQEFEHEDFIDVNLIIRGESEIPKEIDLSFNPIDEELWMKRRFFDDCPDPDKVLTLHSTYKDNKFLDQEYINTLESLIKEDENYYNVYALGLWGKLDTRGKIYKRFNPIKNVAQWTLNKHLPIIVACDFNVDPMKWALIQCLHQTDYVFDEIVKMDTDTESMVKELIKRYGNEHDYHIYGDYSGTFRHTSSRTTDYNIIKQYLPKAQLFLKPNPLVVDRVNAVNWRLCNKEGIRRLIISPNCENVIHDFKHATFKKGTRDEDKQQEKYDGKNPKLALIHITSAIGYYIEYNYGLKGKVTSIIRSAY